MPNLSELDARQLPILFSGQMVRALLAGTKTQTRRVHKVATGLEHLAGSVAPRIRVGDRLWVKETTNITSWSDDGDVWLTYVADGAKSCSLYPDKEDFLERLCARVEKAGAETNAEGWYENIPPSALVRPSIFMPRWASRITLGVTDVRVQRLQDISEDDAAAEGCDATTCANVLSPRDGFPSFRSAYAILWDAINGDGAWAKNPWVAAYTFTVALGNIDSLKREISHA
jgi:hypothetical protein